MSYLIRLSFILSFLFPFYFLQIRANAAEPDPAIYILVDTSGSMLMTIDGSQNTYGDGSVEHPHMPGLTSRLYSAKEAVRTIVNSYGEVRWGLARYEQNSGFNYICMCSSEVPNNISGCGGYGGLWDSADDCRLCDLMQDYPDYDLPGSHDRVCINYAGGILDGCVDPISGSELKGADILVALGDNNETDILKWINNSETDPGEADYISGLSPEEQPDPELRASGGTPIGGALQTIMNQLANGDIHSDPLKGCRPYSVIILTDGAESCGTDPVSVATQMHSVPDMLSSCSSSSQCPPNSTCTGGHCTYNVKTYVIAFAVAPNEFVNCNNIAVAGGTDSAIPAQNTSELVSAMAEIIASSIVNELCNGIDDDCDGSSDEDFPQKGADCDNGELGVCRGTGVYVCASDGTGTVCQINTPGDSPSAEICDGLDNDCNGLVDDGITCTGPAPDICNGIDDDLDPSTPDGADDGRVGQPCGNDLGICVPGVTVCSGGNIVCNTTQGPETEVCDNQDNNCNGLTDENLTQACSSTNAYGTCDGLAYCSEGSWICMARDPEPESCNNFDDNCDGQIDEDLERSCENRNAYGVCHGVEICSAGVWGTCDATEPALDLCDGIDNDCDNQVDEDDPRIGQTCDTGCGVYVCDNGNLVCDGSSGGVEECDGIDNDCDGQIDENIQQECEISNEFGTCPGVEICTNGIWNACNAKVPRQEECNGMDDNCDGVIDENAICPNPDDVCYEGECRSKCGNDEFSCDPTEECVIYPEDEDIKICMPLLKECGMSICNTSEVCENETCINPCDPNPCNELEECTANYRWRDGDPVEEQYICTDASCAVFGHSCDSGEFCWEGRCLTDPCSSLDCDTLEYCKRTETSDGTWSAVCASICSCSEGEVCDSDGTCKPDPCKDVNCDYGKICRDGECVSDDCLFVQCKQGETCMDGTCEWDPCFTAHCPQYASCERVRNSEGTLDAVCVPKDEYYTPPQIKGKVTANGGFGCSTGGNGSGQAPLSFVFLMIFGLFIKTRKFFIRKNLILLLSAVIFLTASACDRNVYVIQEDASFNYDAGDANNNNNNDIIDPDADSCVPSEEICDGLDNNCDGIADEYWIPVSEGGEGHFSDDPANCGSCNNICAFYHGDGICEDGECKLGACDPYYFDLNDDSTDGCEYRCDTMGGEDEVCDGFDNDCDGLTDEYWIPVSEGGEGHFEDDPENCGFCGLSCTGLYPNGIGGCRNGLCYLESCESGWINANGLMSDGCETVCVVTNGGVEQCDGLDNDCDGKVDEDDAGNPLGRPCFSADATLIGVGVCTEGTEYCHNGVWGPLCEGEIVPSEEICDGLDNDCNGDSDETFDFDNDINNCGGCGNSCFTSSPPHAYPVGCSLGTCMFECEYGHHDINGDMTDGCEYECTPTASADTEYCDGIDNDCDNLIDESSDLQPPPANYCRTGGLCGSSVPVSCEMFNGSVQWVCQYPAGVETITNSPNLVVSFETLCDGLDGDCDGTPDDDFIPILNSACEDSVPGVCKGHGTYQCKADKSGTECVITSSGSPSAEVCDGLDNDCDGLTDEPAWNPGTNPSYVNDEVVEISYSGETVYVYKYEASRPEASSSDAGTGNDVRACSKPSVLPWAKVTFEQARQACLRAGMQLCSADVWEEACDGEGTSWQYPYSSSTYNGSACNGRDAGYDTVRPSGSMPACASNGYAIEDLSGNLREWTNSIVAYNSEGKAIYQVRGGSYRDVQDALTCSADTTALVEDAFTSNVGFRCCSFCGNGVLDPGELCDDGNRVSGDGCSAVCGPDTCGNGVVEGSEECDCGLSSSSLPAGCTDINGAPASNCSLNCKIPEERCSILYPEDQDRGGESSDCTDPDCNGTWCADVTDNDGDGFAEPDDCDDSNPNINPAVDEVCNNGIDDNCNGFTDDAEPDKDGDGSLRCVSGNTVDCDDWDKERSPDVPEICGDGIDNNCDGAVDSSCATECEIAAYNRSYIGCEYYAASTMNHWLSSSFDNDFTIVVHNANTTSATVTVSKAGSVVTSATVAPGAIHEFSLAYDQTLKTTINNLVNRAGGAYKIESDIPVTVYQFNPFNYHIGGTYSYTNDASLILPKHVLGRKYLVAAKPTWMWNGNTFVPSYMAILGTEDNTTIRITYNGHVNNGPNKGTVVTYTINEGDVLQIPSRSCGSCGSGSCFCNSDYDFTGTLVEVTNPSGHAIGILAGNDCVNEPANKTACDHTEEEIFPLNTWGKNFVAAHTSNCYLNNYRIVSGEDGNLITFTPSSVHAPVTLNRGESLDLNLIGSDFSVSGTGIMMVYQYLIGQNNFSGVVTDPAAGLLVPMEQYRKSYSFLVPSSMSSNYVNIVKPVGNGAPTVYLDGSAIPESSFSTAIGNSYFGVARIEISSSPYSHEITSSQPFGIIVYGFGSYTSYLYPGGLDLNIINSAD